MEETTRKGESFRKEAKLKRRNAEKSQQLIKRFQRDLFQVVDRRANEDFKALKDGRCATVFPIRSRRRHKGEGSTLDARGRSSSCGPKTERRLEQTVEKLRKQLRKEREARCIEVWKVLKENLELVKAERKKEKKTTVVEKRDMFYSLSKNTSDIYCFSCDFPVIFL